MSNFLLSNEFPELSNELKNLLSDKPDYAAQIDNLVVVDRCRCEDNSCSTMYSLQKPDGAWGDGHENFMLNSRDIIIIDAVNGVIAELEILDRSEIRKKLSQLIP